MPVESLPRAEELLRTDAERLRDEHPDLVEQLREYEKDWREYVELLGRTEDAERPKRPRRRPTRRNGYRTT